MYKKTFIISFMLLLQSNSILYNDSNVLHELIVESNVHSDQIDGWEIVVLDDLPLHDDDTVTAYLKQIGFTKITDDETKQTYHYFYENAHNKINIHFSFIYPSTNASNIRIQMKILGNSWTSEIQKETNFMFYQLKKEIFTKQAEYYTCLILNDDDIINNGIYYKDILRKLNIHPLFVQYDNVEYSPYALNIYGYKDDWESYIQTNNERVNVQIAVKNKENNKNQLIIGTPIILNEY